jgi:hypothetical protein
MMQFGLYSSGKPCNPVKMYFSNFWKMNRLESLPAGGGAKGDQGLSYFFAAAFMKSLKRG